MNITASIKLIEVEGIKIPLLYGFLKPRILLPLNIQDSLSHSEIEHIFLHELAHHKRRDVLTAWLTTILQILHWFNPVIWFAFLRIRIDRELACDELTLTRLGAEQSQAYGQTIISLLQKISTEYRLPVTVGILETKTDLKRRLTMIAQFKKLSGWWTALALVLLAVLGFFSLTEARKAIEELKPLATEIRITIRSDNYVKMDQSLVPVDSLAQKLNEHRFDENSIIALIPTENVSFNNYFQVQQQLQLVSIQKIKCINTKTGKSIIFPQYNFEDMEPFLRPDFNPLFSFNENGKYGYRNRNREVVIEPQFEQARSLTGVLGAVKLNSKWGFINRKGEFVVEPQFEDAHSFHDEMGEVKLKGKWGFIDTTGQIVIEPQFDSVYQFNEGYAGVRINNKWGFIDKTGKFLTAPIYGRTVEIRNGLTYDRAGEFRDGLAAVKLNEKYGFINTKGETAIGFNFDDADSFWDGLAKVRINGKYGYIDQKGTFVIEPLYSDADSFSEGLAAVRQGNDKYGYIDKRGKFIIEPQFDAAWAFQHGLARVIIFENPELNIKGQGFLVDRAGNILHNSQRKQQK